MFCDFFTVAVRTGGPGAGGISLLLLERSMPGIETKQMKCMGVWPSGTTYITFDNVRVPCENLIGAENEGFKCIMMNVRMLQPPNEPHAHPPPHRSSTTSGGRLPSRRPASRASAWRRRSSTR